MRTFVSGFLGGLVFLAAPAIALSAPVTVTMHAQNGSGQTGTATLTQHGANVVVTISIAHGSTTPQPAHIHAGTCATLNPSPSYLLNNVVGGQSTTTLKNFKLTTVETGAFAINVHKSTSAIATYTSCGNIPKA